MKFRASPYEILVIALHARQVVRKDYGVGPLKYSFDVFRDPSFRRLRKGLGKNHHSSSKLPKHPVDNIGMRYGHSFEDNNKALGKYLQEGMEVTLGIGTLFNEGMRRFGGLINPWIESSREDDKYTQV